MTSVSPYLQYAYLRGRYGPDLAFVSRDEGLAELIERVIEWFAQGCMRCATIRCFAG
jgi:hypothetical protein